MFERSFDHWNEDEQKNFKFMKISAEAKGELIDKSKPLLSKKKMVEAYKIQLKI